MDDLIRNLAEKSVNCSGDRDSLSKVAWFIDLQKFAELIVSECVSVAEPNHMNTPEDAVYYVEQAIDRILEHFGLDNK
jgi:ketopantoate reductase